MALSNLQAWLLVSFALHRPMASRWTTASTAWQVGADAASAVLNALPVLPLSCCSPVADERPQRLVVEAVPVMASDEGPQSSSSPHERLQVSSPARESPEPAPEPPVAATALSPLSPAAGPRPSWFQPALSPRAAPAPSVFGLAPAPVPWGRQLHFQPVVSGTQQLAPQLPGVTLMRTALRALPGDLPRLSITRSMSLRRWAPSFCGAAIGVRRTWPTWRGALRSSQPRCRAWRRWLWSPCGSCQSSGRWSTVPFWRGRF
eukprot:s531_g1.t1